MKYSVSDNLVMWAENLELGEHIEWEDFCEAADIPYIPAGEVGRGDCVLQRNAIRAALNKVTGKYQDEPFELLSVKVQDDDWEPDVERGESEADRPMIRVLMKLGGDGRLDARMHHHIQRTKNAPRNMLRDMKLIEKDSNLSPKAKERAKILVKAATIQEHFTGKFLEKAQVLRRLSDATAQRCLADTLVDAEKK